MATDNESSSSLESSSSQQNSSNQSSGSSSQQNSEALPHYHQSPNMIQAKLTMNGIDADSVEKLKAMGIDRRWNCDNRVPTWTFGLVNMGHDFNFLHKGGIICDTDDRVQKIEEDVDSEDGVVRQITKTRNIKYNGQGLQIDCSREE